MSKKIEKLQQATGFDEDVVGCFVNNFEKKGICDKANTGWCKDYYKCCNMRYYLERKAQHKKAKVTKIEYYRDWFVFPLCVQITRRNELFERPIAISIHFLWWHWRYTFLKDLKY